MNETFTSRYGGTFTTAAERDAWDGMPASRQDPQRRCNRAP
nr:hypothetical protein [uncultured Cardiobacterium sp.]